MRAQGGHSCNNYSRGNIGVVIGVALWESSRGRRMEGFSGVVISLLILNSQGA